MRISRRTIFVMPSADDRLFRGPHQAPLAAVTNNRRLCRSQGGILRLMGRKAVL
jgi:hypothetical protein